jgi:hypothetical protein
MKTLEHYHKSLYLQEFHILTDNFALTGLISLMNLERSNVSRSIAT